MLPFGMHFANKEAEPNESTMNPIQNHTHFA